MKKTFKSGFMAVAVAAATTVALLPGSSAIVMAEPAEGFIELDTEQDDGQKGLQKITEADPQVIEPAAKTDELQPEPADETGEELQEPAADSENDSMQVSINDTSGLIITEQPRDVSVSYPEGAQFEVKLNDPSLVESYQWEYYNGEETKVLEGTSAATPKLILPSTRQDTEENAQCRCLITGKDGSVVYSDYASLTIANKDESKTVLYVGEYAALPGESIDLAEKNIGSGTISFDSDGKTVYLDNAIFDDSTIVCDYMTAPAAGIDLYGREVTETEYVICLIGTNVINNTYLPEDIWEAGAAIGLELYGKDSQVPSVIIKGESSTSSLELRSGAYGIYSIGSMTIDTNLHILPYRRADSVGILSELGGVTLAENSNVTIRANGYGILAGSSWEEQSEEMNLVMNKGSVLNCLCDILTPMPSFDGKYSPVELIAVYAKNNIRITDAECDIKLTPSLSKVTRKDTSVGVALGIMAENDISATGSDVTVKLVPNGTSGDIDEFGGISGNNLCFDHTDVKVTSTPYCFNTGLGIGSMGNLFSITNHSDINVNLKADGMIAGFTSYGLIQLDRSNISLKVDATDDNIKFGIQGYNMDFNPGSTGHRVKIDAGENGYAILAFLEYSDKAYNYKKGYQAKQLLLSGDVTAITVPIGGEINRYAYPSSEGGYAICETVYDPKDITKPVSSVVIEVAKDLSGATVSPDKTKYTYTGKAIKPAVTVSLGDEVLEQGRDYTVKYSNNKNVGMATITVTGKGSFTGAATGTFKIVPTGTTLTSVTGGKQQFTVKWKKQTTQTTGYQIQYSTSKTFASGNKTVTISSAQTTGKTIKGLKSKKTYYVRIRTYKTVDGTKFYSGWSDKKSVKTS